MQKLDLFLSNKALENTDPKWNPSYGAELIFWGVVRKTEKGKVIKGIEYSAYEDLAYEMAKKIGGEAIQKYGDHDAKIIHRLGFVAVAEPSVVLRIATPHSKLAYQLSEWYLDKIKNTLPIWKKFV
ncbi:MAG: molybdenum cofactor biosynthesis protein MoaE [Verrucomicrobiota bacterium]|nr:molybdenum cofactor biosynthesis protein MoaE [Verrucomicrobiota bacterium]